MVFPLTLSLNLTQNLGLDRCYVVDDIIDDVIPS